MLRFVVCLVLAGFAAGTWGQGYPNRAVVPAATGGPDIVAEKLAQEVRDAMDKPQVRQRMAALGVEPVPGKPADFRKFVASELKAYGEMVRLAGVKPE